MIDRELRASYALKSLEGLTELVDAIPRNSMVDISRLGPLLHVVTDAVRQSQPKNFMDNVPINANDGDI